MLQTALAKKDKCSLLNLWLCRSNLHCCFGRRVIGNSVRQQWKGIMHLSEFQKNITKSIINRNVYDIESFLQKYCELETTQNKGASFGTNYGSYDSKIQVYIPKDEDAALNNTKEFITLWKALEKNDLLFSIAKTVKRSYVFPVFTKRNPTYSTAPFNEILAIIKDYDFKEIVFTPELEKFVERNFLTSDEYDKEQERLDRVESQKLTRKIAYITIVISVIISLITALFNFLTYTKDRNVRIVNDSAFQDTIKVTIINGKDSIFSKDSTILK